MTHEPNFTYTDRDSGNNKPVLLHVDLSPGTISVQIKIQVE